MMRRSGRQSRQQRDRRQALAAAAVTAAAILGLAAAALWRPQAGARAGAAATSDEVLAVVPFRAVTPDPQNAWLGVGLAESIISRFAGVSGLTVRSLSASLGAPGLRDNPVAAGKRLGAGAVLAGDYTLKGDSFSIDVRLLDVATGATLWTHRVDGQGQSIPEVERKIVDDTLAALFPGASPPVAPARRPVGGRSAGAHVLYLNARGKLASQESTAVPDAIDLLERAIALDPEFPRAHAALAVACSLMTVRNLSAEPEWIERGVASGRRAVYLDDKDPMVHSALAHALMAAGDPVGAAREAVRSLELNPSNAEALRFLALLRAGAGVAAPVRALREAARRADPSIQTVTVDFWLMNIERDFDRGAARLEESLEWRRRAGLSLELPIVHLGFLAFESGDAVAGLRWAAMLEDLPGSRARGELVHLLALARMGDTAGVRSLAKKNYGYYAWNWSACEYIGRALSLLGEKEEALTWLERAQARGDFDAGTWERCETLDGVRGNERFQSALAIVRERSRAIVEILEFAGYP